MKTIAISLVVALACGLPEQAASAADAPAFDVATFQTGGFYETGVVPRVLRNTSGDFLVIGEMLDVRFAGRAYHADGTPKGDVFQLAQPAPGTAQTNDFSAAMDGDGRFAMGWLEVSNTSDSYTFVVYLQRYAADGTAQGAPIAVGTYTFPMPSYSAGMVNAPKLAMDDAGDIAVAWTVQRTPSGPPGRTETYAALYAADGSMMVKPKAVDWLPVRFDSQDGTWHSNRNLLLGMAMNGSGELVMAFRHQDDSSTQLAVRRFKPGLVSRGGLKLLPDVQNANFSNFRQGYPRLGVDASGRFDVEWSDADGAVFVSRYSGRGSLRGTVGLIATPEATDPYASLSPDLAVAPNGEFAVVWNGPSSRLPPPSNPSYPKYGQFFHASGHRHGGAFVIDDNADSLNTVPTSCAVDGSGNLVVAWDRSRIDDPFGESATDTLRARLIQVP